MIPARGGDVVRLFLTKTSIPNSSYPAVAASFVVELGFDVAMGSLILIFAFTQGVFPKPPDFAKLNAFDLSFFAQNPQLTLFVVTLLGVGALLAVALLSTRAIAFWERIRQGFTILEDRERYFREVFAVQFAGWCFRFAAFWMLLEAFNVGGSVKNVLLVLGVNAVSAAVPFTPQGAGVQQALLTQVFAGTAAGATVAAYSVGPADRHRRAHLRDRLHGPRVHLPGAQLQGGDRARARGPSKREGHEQRHGARCRHEPAVDGEPAGARSRSPRAPRAPE